MGLTSSRFALALALLLTAGCPPSATPTATACPSGVLFFGACAPASVLTAYCRPAAAGASRCVPLPACVAGGARDVATGACLSPARTREVSAARGRSVADDLELACPLGDELERSATTQELACAAPLLCSAARGSRVACHLSARCGPGHVPDARGRCARVVTPAGVDVARWARLVLGEPGGEGSAVACALLSARLGPTAEPREVQLVVRVPDNDASLATLDGDVAVVRALEPLASALRHMSAPGAASAAALDVRFSCPATRHEPVPQPIPMDRSTAVPGP